jgi:hypothetical protein
MLRCLFMSVWIPLLLSCEETRVQYRKTPAFYDRMADVKGLEGGQTKDGTEIRFVRSESNTFEGFKDHTGKIFYMREVRADGTTALNALAPEHVLLNTIDCLTNHEYELLWDEMISESTRAWYDGEETGGKEACLEFFRVNRKELAATLNRMKGGLHLSEVERSEPERGLIRLRLTRQIAHQFVFTELDTRRENGKYVLVMIR